MTGTCLKCGENKEHRRGSKTGETARSVSRLRNEINDLRVLTLTTGAKNYTLCIECMSELLSWLTDGDAHVRGLPKTGPKKDTKAVELRKSRIRFDKLRISDEALKNAAKPFRSASGGVR